MRICVFASLGFSALLPLYAQVSVAPYSATQVTQRVQTLADGTHITQPEQKTLMYRDSQGRTRMEMHSGFRVPNPNVAVTPPVMANIADPLAGFHYAMDTRKKIARRTVYTPGTIVAGTPAKNQPRPKLESLGTQVIGGLLCDGLRITNTMPAGAMGNDRDLVTVTETWMSQELHILVLSKTSDPGNGESTTKLTDISRVEPDPALFMVPADYTIEDQ